MRVLRTFRPAGPASPAWNLAKTAAQTIVFWGLFLVALPWLVCRAEAVLGVPLVLVSGQQMLGVVGFVVFGALGLTSGAYMAVLGAGTPLPLDAARRLVVRGPYRWVRNPMALAGVAQGVAVGVYVGSVSVVGYALMGAVLWDRWVRPLEERDLAQRFGPPFERYRDAVRCWWPHLRGFAP